MVQLESVLEYKNIFSGISTSNGIPENYIVVVIVKEMSRQIADVAV